MSAVHKSELMARRLLSRICKVGEDIKVGTKIVAEAIGSTKNIRCVC